MPHHETRRWIIPSHPRSSPTPVATNLTAATPAPDPPVPVGLVFPDDASRYPDVEILPFSRLLLPGIQASTPNNRPSIQKKLCTVASGVVSLSWTLCFDHCCVVRLFPWFSPRFVLTVSSHFSLRPFVSHLDRCCLSLTFSPSGSSATRPTAPFLYSRRCPRIEWSLSRSLYRLVMFTLYLPDAWWTLSYRPGSSSPLKTSASNGNDITTQSHKEAVGDATLAGHAANTCPLRRRVVG